MIPVLCFVAGFVCCIIYVVIGVLFFEQLEQLKSPGKKFILTGLIINDSLINFSHQNNTIMTTVTHKDVDAMGKSITALFSLAKDAAGNFPDLVEGSLAATSSNEAVATASVGAVDKEAGTYELKIAYTGKKGSADCKLIASPDLDGSGDANIEGLVTSIITTEEASSFGEPVISPLQ